MYIDDGVTTPGTAGLAMANDTVPEALTAAAELQELLLATDNVEDFLRDLAVLAARSVTQGLSCGITLKRDGRPYTVANSDDRAARCDEMQYGQGHGPCLDAIRTGEIILVEDLVEEERWGDYRTSVLAHGVRSSLSLPLSDGIPGALNFYASRPRAFGETEREYAQRFASEASRALALATRMARQSELTTQLEAALASRATIDQAIGIIMAQNRCDADQGFDLLRAASQNRNVKLRTVAAEIVTAVSGKPPTPGG
ncbi:MAG TPA: GAF and ANTAR domain-containing protein [Pseudonocardiaceae bacterium]|jgi:GAF domain-containing protein|nr:GAF and ANTAR domain-containing protein [Pseudonocardiaceae bacterium]